MRSTVLGGIRGAYTGLNVDETEVDETAELAEPETEETADAEDAETEEVEDSEAGESEGEEASAEPSESSTEKPTEPEIPDGAQQRIDELTRRHYADQQRIAELAQRVEAAERAERVEPGKTLADFDFDEAKYQEYANKVAQQNAADAVRAEQQAAEQARRVEQFAAREAAFAPTVPDYRIATSDPTLPISPDMAEVIQGAEKGPEIAYYFAKNREEAALIARLPLVEAAMEIGRIAATKLVAPPKPEKKPPEPPAKIAAKSTPRKIASNTPESDNLSDAEYYRREEARLAKKRAG